MWFSLSYIFFLMNLVESGRAVPSDYSLVTAVQEGPTPNVGSQEGMAATPKDRISAVNFSVVFQTDVSRDETPWSPVDSDGVFAETEMLRDENLMLSVDNDDDFTETVMLTNETLVSAVDTYDIVADNNSNHLYDILSVDMNSTFTETKMLRDVYYQMPSVNTDRSFREEGAHPVHSDEEELELSYVCWQILEQNVHRCHLVLVTSGSRHLVADGILKYNSLFSQPLGIIDVDQEIQTEVDYFLKALWGSSSSTCRAVLVDLTTGYDEVLFRFLEKVELWKWSDAKVIMIGSKSEAKDALYHHALRNTLHPFYLELQEGIVHDLSSRPKFLSLDKRISQNVAPSSPGGEERRDSSAPVDAYTRCLYCHNGMSQVQYLSAWSQGSSFRQMFTGLLKQRENLQGHELRVVSIAYPPYVDYKLDSDEPATTVTLLDSLDKRLLDTFTKHMNFSYVVRVPWDMVPGYQLANGSWTGKMGAIYFGNADLTTTTGQAYQRLPLIDHERTCAVDRLVIISMKPQLLPQYLVIIRPLTGDVWLYLVLSIIVWGISLWLLLKMRSYFSSRREDMSLSTAIFYSCAVILEDPPCRSPTSTTGRMLVGWWLVACLLISTAFRSSLVAHLTVESKTIPIDSFGDMVGRANWHWGLDIKLFLGIGATYFKTSPDPVVKEVYRSLEGIDVKEGLTKTLKGRYSLLASKNRISAIIGAFHTNAFGETPFYISKEGYNLAPDIGWGFRKGAPYRPRISQLINRLIEAGVIDYWIKNVMTLKIKKIREEALKQNNLQQATQPKEERRDDRVVLRVTHLMGIFLVILLGNVISALTFVAEKIVYGYDALYLGSG